MSTRAIYIFADNFDNSDTEVYAVYKHHDGYPDGARGFIVETMKYAWEMPRFEADEFAAAFVAANKRSPGGVRLYPQALRLRKILELQGDARYIYWIDKPAGFASIRVRYQEEVDGPMNGLDL